MKHFACGALAALTMGFAIVAVAQPTMKSVAGAYVVTSIPPFGPNARGQMILTEAPRQVARPRAAR